jgi:hypothetical protein
MGHRARSRDRAGGRATHRVGAPASVPVMRVRLARAYSDEWALIARSQQFVEIAELGRRKRLRPRINLDTCARSKPSLRSSAGVEAAAFDAANRSPRWSATSTSSSTATATAMTTREDHEKGRSSALSGRRRATTPNSGRVGDWGKARGTRWTMPRDERRVQNLQSPRAYRPGGVIEHGERLEFEGYRGPRRH